MLKRREQHDCEHEGKEQDQVAVAAQPSRSASSSVFLHRGPPMAYESVRMVRGHRTPAVPAACATIEAQTVGRTRSHSSPGRIATVSGRIADRGHSAGLVRSRFGFLRQREQMAALTTDADWEELTKARLPVLETALQELLS